MNNEKQIGGDLLELSKDERDFMLGVITKLPLLSELPDEFSHTPLEIKNQLGSDFCAAFSSCGASELQEGVLLSPEYQFALIKEIMGGDVDSFGADLRTAMKSFVKVGSIEKRDSPYSVETKDSSFLRRIENWPVELKQKALVHSKNTYVQVSGPYDDFDNIKATIWMYRKEKRIPIFGVRWNWPVNNPYIETPISGGGGHALYAIGWKVVGGRTYLVVPNSYGKNSGENGIFYFSREVINEFVSTYGAFIFIDITPEEYLKRVEEMKLGIMAKILNLMKYVLTLQWLILEKKKEKPQPEPRPAPQPIPQPEPKVSKLISWAKSIETYENFNKLYCNPGAIRGTDGKFLKFDTYQEGFDYLRDYLKRAATNKHPAYKAENTLFEFFAIYSPAYDGNNPDRYAQWVANQLDVLPTIQIKDLV